MLHKYLFEESLTLKCKRRFECDIADGIADLICSHFCTYDDFNLQNLTRLLLSHFNIHFSI